MSRGPGGNHYVPKLQQQLADRVDVQPLATEMQALAAVKQQLRDARTWPYDTEMARTFFLAVFAPLFVGMARSILDQWSQ